MILDYSAPIIINASRKKLTKGLLKFLGIILLICIGVGLLELLGIWLTGRYYIHSYMLFGLVFVPYRIAKTIILLFQPIAKVENNSISVFNIVWYFKMNWADLHEILYYTDTDKLVFFSPENELVEFELEDLSEEDKENFKITLQQRIEEQGGKWKTASESAV